MYFVDPVLALLMQLTNGRAPAQNGKMVWNGIACSVDRTNRERVQMKECGVGIEQ